MLTSLSGRSVVVTGASKGIGKGMARVFASKGAQVLIVARDLAQAEAAASEIGAGASAVAADVSNPEDCARMAQTAVERHDGIDIVEAPRSGSGSRCCGARYEPAAGGPGSRRGWPVT